MYFTARIVCNLYFFYTFCILFVVFVTDVFQSPTTTLQKDESLVKVMVRIPNQHIFKDVSVFI